jgi:hypothetical protein
MRSKVRGFYGINDFFFNHRIGSVRHVYGLPVLVEDVLEVDGSVEESREAVPDYGGVLRVKDERSLDDVQEQADVGRQMQRPGQRVEDAVDHLDPEQLVVHVEPIQVLVGIEKYLIRFSAIQ